MSGYFYGEDQPTWKCPYCKSRCDADFVDVGVGMMQCGPYHCVQCGASEIGPHDRVINPFRQSLLEQPSVDESCAIYHRILTKEESETGWYAPASAPGSSANVIGGKIVSHTQMRDTYRDEFIANPLWNSKDYVEQWWEDIREER